MDFGNFKPADWLLVAGGAVMLIFGLALPWRSISAMGVSRSGDNAFDFFFTGGISWILVSAVGVLAFLVAGKVLKPDVAPWNLIFIGAAAIATLLMLIRLILGGGTISGVDFDRASGMYVAFVAAAVSLGGALWKFVESGGSLKDLTDANKLKSSFSKSD